MNASLDAEEVRQTRPRAVNKKTKKKKKPAGRAAVRLRRHVAEWLHTFLYGSVAAWWSPGCLHGAGADGRPQLVSMATRGGVLLRPVAGVG